MASTKVVLTSIHGRVLGVSADNHLVFNGRTIPMVDDAGAVIRVQASPGALDATGALTSALIKGGIVTSTTAAVTIGTLPTGTVLDATFTGKNALVKDDAFEWCVINTGPSNFTANAASGHTIVGGVTVVPYTTGRFLTRKTAANTYVTYRVAG